MELMLSQVAAMVQGQLQGDPQKIITGIAPFEMSGPADITFAGSSRFLKRLHETQAGAILVPASFVDSKFNLIQVHNPQIAFSQIVRLFHPVLPFWSGISPSASISQNAEIGKDAAIAPFVVIQDHVTIGDRVTLHPHVVIGNHVNIGDDVEIYPNVTLLNGTKIGNRVVIHAGTVIGSDGFGYTPDDKGSYHRIPHTGIVQIDDDVEIGAVNTIDRATYGKTWIQEGVKTDNLVHIAHNVVVGENTVLVAQVGIAGSATIGKHAVLAGQVGISGHITIGNHVTIGPQSGIAGSVADGTVVSGSPEMPHRQWLKVQRIIPRLPDMKKKIGDIEKRLEEIEATLNQMEI